MATPLIGNLLNQNNNPLFPQQTTANNPITPLEPIGSPQAVVSNATTTPAQTRDVNAVTRTVDKPTETVQGQLDSFLSSGSPILERARAGATQTANKRGLINSSIAAGAGESAAIDAATPIATSDANIYNQAAGQNLQYQNQAASQNSQQGTQVNLSNATEQNKASSQNAQLSSQIAQSNADNNLKLIMQNADDATKTALATMDAQNRNLLQTNASAADLYKQGQTAISQIIMNKDLDGPAKNAAIAQQLQLMKNGMSLIGNISGLSFTDPSGNQVGMDKLLDFTKTNTQPVDSPQLIAARNAVQAAQGNLDAMMAYRGNSASARNNFQRKAREELAAAKSAYEQIAAQQAAPAP